ncbi:MAG: amino acid adenylation domain-containing protein [Jatrophihabitantaceae bacterium]
MSTTAILALLDEIKSRGLSVSVDGEDLRLQGQRDRIDPELVGRIKAVKPNLIGYLQAGRLTGERSFDITLLQRGYLIGRGAAVELGNIASHVYHEIAGHWDLNRLTAALNRVVARHGMLRTCFTDDGRQLELDAVPELTIARYDLRALDPGEQRQRLLELRDRRSHRIFPADTAPMLAVEVSILADDQMVLHVGHDGLIMDGISTFLFFRQWHAAYQGESDPVGGEASFADYVASLAKARTQAPYERSRAYWLDRLDELAGCPDLPLEGTPAAIIEPRFTSHVARLDAAAWAEVKARAAARGLTPTGVLLTAYAETLSRWGAGERFTLNSTLANRPPIHPRILEAIGNFSETILMEIELDRRLTFTERAQALQARLRRDLDNRHFSGIEVLRELGRRAGATQARMPYTFNSAIGYVDATLDGSTVELFGPEIYTSSQTPQVWLNGFAFEQHDGVVVQVDEVHGLFPVGLIDAMMVGYQTLLDSLVTEEAWDARTFDLLPESQRAARQAANDTETPLDVARLEDAFVQRAHGQPDAAAVITATGMISYGELYRRALAAAAWLRARQVGRNELVGLVMTRGPEQLVGILATILAGAAYLPIDAKLPVKRQRYMLADGRVRCVLTNADTVDSAAGLQVLTLDVREPVSDTQPVLEQLPGAGLDDLAYVLYTSGTTGEPKGVMVNRRSVANVVADCQRRFNIRPSDRFFGISAFNFDLSVWDVFGALSAGAAVVLPDHDRATDPVHWLQLCEQAEVSVWNSVPALVALLQEHAAQSGAAPLGALRLVLMSGDRLPPLLPANLRSLLPRVQICSLGGPTETTIWNILHPIEEGFVGQTIPYGRPNSNNRAYILDDSGQEVPDWVPGEICAAGTGLAVGYWGDQARTDARFFYDPARNERMFRTGDLGRYLPDGTIAILGRIDFQIKINGYRIEAGEVETRLTGIPAIKQAVVVRQSGVHGDRLVAHLVAAGADRPSDEEIRGALREHLPEYMVPSVLHWQNGLPLTRNGKIDRSTLERQVVSGREPTTRHSQGPATELQQRLAALWAAVLRCDADELGLDDGFHAASGDSLVAARILIGVRKQFGVGITLERFVEVDTIRAMATHIESALAEQAARTAQPARA